jgi:ribosomal protein S6--L-glutamate ligase
MILSFHPCFEGDKNIICAGRSPDGNDLRAIKAAEKVILPQGCKEDLYRMAHQNCRHVFPDYKSKFEYSGKTGQIKLFKKTGVPHPESKTFENIETHRKKYSNTAILPEGFDFPVVFKFDWGGEGETVFLIKNIMELNGILKKAASFEASGQRGFLIQEYIESKPQVLRIAVIGETFTSYWRVNESEKKFGAGLAGGGRIDRKSNPEIQKLAVASAKNFCKKTGINLAGFDFLFRKNSKKITPLFLEINYFFGRKGLGDSENFYKLLNSEIKNWISRNPS